MFNWLKQLSNKLFNRSADKKDVPAAVPGPEADTALLGTPDEVDVTYTYRVVLEEPSSGKPQAHKTTKKKSAHKKRGSQKKARPKKPKTKTTRKG
jgi:hypothetical protein